MLARICRTFYLTRGERAVAMAYAGVMAVAGGITIMIMSGLDGANAISSEPTFHQSWATIAGAFSGGISLFLLRKWMGRRGYTGIARAVLGAMMVAFLSAFIAGSLIAPLDGTVMGPALLLTVFVRSPWLLIAWMTIGLSAHFLLMVWTNERSWSNQRAVMQLSRLSQLNFYGRRVDY